MTYIVFALLMPFAACRIIQAFIEIQEREKIFLKISSPFKLKQNIIVIKFEAIQISNKKENSITFIM